MAEHCDLNRDLEKSHFKYDYGVCLDILDSLENGDVVEVDSVFGNQNYRALFSAGYLQQVSRKDGRWFYKCTGKARDFLREHGPQPALHLPE